MCAVLSIDLSFMGRQPLFDEAQRLSDLAALARTAAVQAIDTHRKSVKGVRTTLSGRANMADKRAKFLQEMDWQAQVGR